MKLILRTQQKDWLPTKQLDPWNLNFGNPFVLEEWKPLPTLLEGREKDYVQVDYNCSFNSSQINVQPLQPQMMSMSDYVDVSEKGRQPENQPSPSQSHKLQIACEVANMY